MADLRELEQITTGSEGQAVLFLVPLAALVCDLLFGSHDLGRWGGRGVKLTLVVLAIGSSVALFVTGADRARDGLITSRWEDVDPAEVGRPRRRLYQVTPAAAGALDRSRDLQTAPPTPRLAAP